MCREFTTPSMKDGIPGMRLRFFFFLRRSRKPAARPYTFATSAFIPTKSMKLKPIMKYCYAKLWNKQFLVFLFFLALSSAFWVFQALNETYEEDFLVPIELRNLPDNVVITTDLPEAFHVTMRDKGIILANYRFGKALQPVVIDFNTYSNANGHVSIPVAELIKQVAVQLAPSTQMISIKPDTLEFFYNYGECKKVPVVVQGNIRTGRLFSLSGTTMEMDSVTVYASKEILDTITGAYTRQFNLSNLTDTTSVRAELLKVRGAKFEPNQVGIRFCVDRLVEKTVQVPVQQVNFPASKQLRTFPATVSVTFQVGMGLYRKVTSENFVLVVNYEDLLKNKSNKCHLSLKTVPTGVSHVRISPQDVEYIIEEISDAELESENY